MAYDFSSYAKPFKNYYGRVSSFFGYRNRFRTSNGNWSSSFHGGIDLPASAGTPVPAMADGVIEKVVNNPAKGYGNYVVLRHADGSKSLYAHLSSFGDIQPGMSVSKGTLLGGVGSTGNSTGNHLHFTLFNANGEKVDPLKYYSLEDFNRAASGCSFADPTLVAQQNAQSAYTSLHANPQATSWQCSAPAFLGGMTQEEKMAYQAQEQLDKEVFAGVSVGALKDRGVSSESIAQLQQMSTEIANMNQLRNSFGLSAKQLTEKDFIENNIASEDIRVVMDVARNSRQC